MVALHCWYPPPRLLNGITKNLHSLHRYSDCRCPTETDQCDSAFHLAGWSQAGHTCVFCWYLCGSTFSKHGDEWSDRSHPVLLSTHQDSPVQCMCLLYLFNLQFVNFSLCWLGHHYSSFSTCVPMLVSNPLKCACIFDLLQFCLHDHAVISVI